LFIASWYKFRHFWHVAMFEYRISIELFISKFNSFHGQDDIDEKIDPLFPSKKSTL